IALAFVAGLAEADFEAAAAAARRMYDEATAAADERPDGLPAAFELHQNYPNPFNPTTRIRFDLPRAAEVSLKIYNTLGQEVTVLHEGPLAPGRHAVDWEAAGDLASGVYFYRLTVGDTQQTRKMVLLK
ncbi:MAG TPA: T9SS type A sorting domain-containing protein, partial [candidate division Zixibacteria bacterium]|nr:T9SS type A sorting domain-containing protein [candidate division Zixibacteria bacterium]